MCEHGAGKVGDDGQGLCVEVAEDSVGFPATHQLDDVGIDVTTEEGHGPARAERAGPEFGREVVEVG